MHADGSAQRQLAFDPTPKDQLPDWSPNGSTIASVAQTALVGADISLINADGSDPHPLTSDQ
jgi:Tol biopolymer transport system component